MYQDAIADPVLSKYLPSKEQLSGKLPERDFFFGILCTLKNQYMKDVIADAQKKRYGVQPDDERKQGILITGAWLNSQSIPITPVRTNSLFLQRSLELASSS